MSRLVKQWIPILIATTTGVVVLAGYLIPVSPLTYYRDRLIEWAVIVAAFAFILGVFNLLQVHGRRVVRLERGGLYSLVLLLAAFVAWIPPVLEGASGKLSQQIFEYVIGPLGGSLAALVVFTLTLAALRLLRTRRSLGSLLFIVVAAAAMLGSTPLTGLEWLADLRAWVINVPAMAGMRGLLLGVALGTVVTALRLLMAVDRPHTEF